MNSTQDILPHPSSLNGLFDSKNLQQMIASSLLEPVSEFLTRPQKNVRTKLVELGYRLSLNKDQQPLPKEISRVIARGGQIIEMIHSGSLIVDDIQDASLVRRNGPALHVEHGIPLALNAGNWLYFWALSQLIHLDLSTEVRPELSHDILSLMMKAHAGQALDVGSRVDGLPKKTVRETCLASMELKSGTLMTLALRIGAGIAGGRWKKDKLDFLGTSLGVLLQMYDDAGNFLSNGPKKYEDLKLKRPTWVWAVASEYEDQEYAAFIAAVNLLPDEGPLLRWMEINNFRHKLLSEIEMYKTFCEVSWSSDWEKTHPLSFKSILLIKQKLEKSYV